jgi:hypothetical protein
MPEVGIDGQERRGAKAGEKGAVYSSASTTLTASSTLLKGGMM